jgi:protein-S-isoprenylcysteine O-methyltransferase Ste14
VGSLAAGASIIMKDTAARTVDLDRFQYRRKVALAVLLGVMFFFLLFVRTFETNEDGLHEYVEKFGIAAILLAILGRMWCTLYIGGRKSAEVVRTGPYSISRNPLYFFSAIGAIGVGAMIGSVTVAVLFGVLCYIAFQYVITVEEGHLTRIFGEPYEAYLREVPRFFPAPGLYSDLDAVSVRPWAIYRTFGDGLFFLAAYPFFEIVEHLQATGMLPVLVHLY